ncbi:hypothetical protein [Aquibaculum arenosum]|uniref:hypothetical protein n=1 Tax=Aquibaculum arenosum TaxID=3032591 RepID=UPI003F58E444
MPKDKVEEAYNYRLAALAVEPGTHAIDQVGWHMTDQLILPDNETLEHCCDAWSKLIDQPWCIMSLGWGQWVHQ